MRKLTLLSLSSLFLSLTLGTQACSKDGNGDGDGDSAGTTINGDGDGDSDDNGDGDGDSNGNGDTDVDFTTNSGNTGDGDSGYGGAGPVCKTASSDADIPPVFLAFAFDVSGSMGKLDRPYWWHDPTFKWQPVVQATSAFFEATGSNGISASMTFFPSKEDNCEIDSYTQPDVSMTELPSGNFADAFADYEDEVGTPLAGGDWRGNTPTYAALSGVSESLMAARDEHPDAKFAIVLVTDGLPQSCDEGLEEATSKAAELLGDGLPTYVIGIENPTTPPAALPDGWNDWGNCDGGDGSEPCTPPDTLAALHELAEAGGAGTAFLIDTNNPNATQEAFLAAIETIRESALSCSIPIPENPEGGSFEKDNIDVTVTTSETTTRLAYDANCDDPMSWHYDNEEAPEAIELCNETCSTIKAKPDAELRVAFLCEPREEIIR